MRRVVAGVLVIGAAVAVGVAVRSRPPAAAPMVPAGVGCVARVVGGEYAPDPACTPGAINPAVTQASIAGTICQRGWASGQRKALFPLAVSERVKAAAVRQYGQYSGPSLRGYELDHLIPVSLGGAIAGTAKDHPNLWPEHPGTPNGKDRVEAELNRWVCSGRITLGRAQDLIRADWVQAGVVVGVADIGAGGGRVVDSLAPAGDGD